MIITAMHHDGFAMFGSSDSRFNIVDATPFRRDVMKECAAACKASGMRLGLYYSQSQDWHEPDATGNSWEFTAPGGFPRYLRRKAFPRIREFLANYGPIATIWFDTRGPITPRQSRDLVDLVHASHPDTIVNSRIGNGLGDYDTLGDLEIPCLPRPDLRESVDTHNDSSGYAANGINFKSARGIVPRLVQVVAKNGVSMLNVGPDGKGRIPAPSVRVLAEVGQWANRHEAAIYGSVRTPLAPLPWGRVHHARHALFLRVLDWPPAAAWSSRPAVQGDASPPRKRPRSRQRHRERRPRSTSARQASRSGARRSVGPPRPRTGLPRSLRPPRPPHPPRTRARRSGRLLLGPGAIDRETRRRAARRMRRRLGRRRQQRRLAVSHGGGRRLPAGTRILLSG